MARPRTGAFKVPTTERILVAAERTFGVLGFERATLADIAKDAGIRRPSLLYYFKTKNELYENVVHRVFDELRTSLKETMISGPFPMQIESLAMSFVNFAEHNQSFAPIVLREIIDGRGPARDILLDEMVPLLAIVENWIENQGRDDLPTDISIRSAVLQFCSNVLLRNASGPLRGPLWGKEENSIALVRQLFLKSAD